MKKLILLFLLFVSPALSFGSGREDQSVVTDNFDKVETNHFYDEYGKHIFDQVIWYDWVAGWGSHRMEAWRLVKSPNVYPTLNRNTNQYESLFYDNDILRKVTAKYMVESWTQYDPELEGRETWPKERRRDLTAPRVKKKETMQGTILKGVDVVVTLIKGKH